MRRLAAIFIGLSLVLIRPGTGAAQPTAYCTFTPQTGAVVIGGYDDLGVAATDIGSVLMYGQKAWIDNQYLGTTYWPCEDGSKFVTLDQVTSIEIRPEPIRGSETSVVIDGASWVAEGETKVPTSGLWREQMVVTAPVDKARVESSSDDDVVTIVGSDLDLDGDGKPNLSFVAPATFLFVKTKGGDDTIDARDATFDELGLDGGPHDDEVFGSPGDDNLYGAGGKDLLVAGAGNDTVYGGDQGTRLYGGEGVDQLFSSKSGGGVLLNGGPDAPDACDAKSNDFVHWSCEIVT